jgi:hypothetical protein
MAREGPEGEGRKVSIQAACRIASIQDEQNIM